MGTENHKVPVVKISEVLVHPNADKLEIIHTLGYQTVVQKGQFKPGDLAVFIPPDSVVPQTEPFRFLWEGHQEEPDGEVREKYRRVTVRKFRKEWSEGLLMPFEETLNEKNIAAIWGEGDDVSGAIGIHHYNPPEPEDGGENEKGPSRKQSKFWPRSLRGWWYLILKTFGFDANGVTGGWNERAPDNTPPIYDVEALKNFPGEFNNDEEVILTEKIHGSNARFVYQDGKMYAGSRKLWKSPKSPCIWRRAVQSLPWIEEWCRNYPGHVLYGEVVPTQEKYRYGCAPTEIKFFVFDIRTPKGDWISWTDRTKYLLPHLENNWVPIVDERLFHEKTILQMAEGKSEVSGANHIREGVVVRPKIERHVKGLGRLQLKVVSNQFLEGDK